jgi:hypothetical protein
VRPSEKTAAGRGKKAGMDAGTGVAEVAQHGEGRGWRWEWWRVAQGGSSEVVSGGTEEAGGGNAEPLRATRGYTCARVDGISIT